MNTRVYRILKDLESNIRILEQENDVLLTRSNHCFHSCKTSINQLKAQIIKFKFKSQLEEIKFFKEIKPLFTSKLIYHLSIYNIEAKKPNGGKEVIRKYLQRELDKLKHYFDYNLDFYRYYRTGANYLDHKYFVRNKFDLQLNPDAYIFENDTRFCTSHDYKVAKILANDQLQVFLEEELANVERKESLSSTPDYSRFFLAWTESKTSLIELIYALQSQGAFKNGRADIKEIATYFELIFNIDLGDYYKTYLELKMRKSSRTKFIDTIRDKLVKRMDSNDELI